MAKIIFGRLFHLAKNFGTHLRRSKLFVPNLNPGVAIVSLHNFKGHELNVFLNFLVRELPTNKTLGRVECVLWVRHGLTLCRRTDKNLPIFHVSNDGRGGSCTFAVFNNLRLTRL